MNLTRKESECITLLQVEKRTPTLLLTKKRLRQPLNKASHTRWPDNGQVNNGRTMVKSFYGYRVERVGHQWKADVGIGHDKGEIKERSVELNTI